MKQRNRRDIIGDPGHRIAQDRFWFGSVELRGRQLQVMVHLFIAGNQMLKAITYSCKSKNLCLGRDER